MAILTKPSVTLRIVRRLFDGGAALTGKTVAIVVQRLSDDKYWTGAAWQAGYSTAGNFTENADGAPTAGLYYFDYAVPAGDEQYLCMSLYNNSGQLLYWDELLVAQAMTLAAGSITAAVIATDAIDADALAADAIDADALAADAAIEIAAAVHATTTGDIYEPLITYIRDDSAATDYITVTWLKNGVAQTSGVTVAKITLDDLSVPAVLINAQSLSDVGSHKFLYTATGAERLPLGAPGMVTATATIDGSPRTWYGAIGRDGP